MAEYTTYTSIPPNLSGLSLATSSLWRRVPFSGVPYPAAQTTYFFRRTDGTRGSTADLTAIPAGAVIERQVTS